MESAEDFPFPFPPYKIQADFMKSLYDCLENGNLGIFESPTGTGKTLSIICGALKWLIDNQEKQKKLLIDKKEELENKIKEIEKKNAADWFLVQTEKIELSSEKQLLQKKLDTMSKEEDKMLKYKKQVEEHKAKKETKKQYSTNDNWKNVKNSKKKELSIEEENIEKEVFFDEDLILNDLDDHSDNSDEEEEIEKEHSQRCKIFFCSRTHSQLSQFIGELNKSPYSNQVSLVPLASRYILNIFSSLISKNSQFNFD